MKPKHLNVVLIIALTALLFIAFDSLTSKAGSLEPAAPPQLL